MNKPRIEETVPPTPIIPNPPQIKSPAKPSPSLPPPLIETGDTKITAFQLRDGSKSRAGRAVFSIAGNNRRHALPLVSVAPPPPFQGGLRHRMYQKANCLSLSVATPPIWPCPRHTALRATAISIAASTASNYTLERIK